VAPLTDRPFGEPAVVVGVTRILGRSGARMEVRRPVDLGELTVGGCTVPASQPVDVDLDLECDGAAIVATGTVRAVADGECRRCLDLFPVSVDLRVREVFERRPTEGETYPIVGETIDLAPVLRDAVLLALPLAPLCRPDCPGPAPERFPTGGPTAPENGEEPEPVVAPDPRWAALSELRLDD